MHSIGNGQGSPIGIDFQDGIDQPGKRTFAYWQLGFIPGHSFSYESTGSNGVMGSTPGTVTVAGKTRNTWYYGYTVGFHLGTLEGNPALQPFATVGANLVLIGKATDATMDDINNGGYAYYGIDKYPSDQVFTGSATATVGCIYNFATTAGVKLDLGYNYSFSGSSSNTEYKFYTSHMFVSLGVRLHIIDK